MENSKKGLYGYDYVENSMLNPIDFLTQEDLSEKQDTLVSGENIKTINKQSILGNGNIEITSGTSGTSDYSALTNKPQIAGIELSGNKSLEDLGIQAKGDYATTEQLSSKVDATAIADMLTKTDATSTYAAKTHQHVSANITDLQNKLDAKANTLDLANYATTASTANFITKDVNNLTNYEPSTVAQGKYALQTALDALIARVEALENKSQG